MNVRMLAPDSSSSETYSATGAGRPGAYVAYWNLSTAADVTRLSATKNGEFSFTIGTGGKTPVVGSITVPAATTTIDSAAAVTVRLSNGTGGATLSFDKTSYRPGEQALLIQLAPQQRQQLMRPCSLMLRLQDLAQEFLRLDLMPW